MPITFKESKLIYLLNSSSFIKMIMENKDKTKYY